MSKFCTKCGKEIDKDDIFCQYCGKQLIEETEEGEQAVQTNNNNSLAVAGFVVSLVSLIFSMWGITSVVAIVLSAVALSQIKKTNENGKGLAVAGLIIGIVVLVLTIISIAFLIFATILGL